MKNKILNLALALLLTMVFSIPMASSLAIETIIEDDPLEEGLCTGLGDGKNDACADAHSNDGVSTDAFAIINSGGETETDIDLDHTDDSGVERVYLPIQLIYTTDNGSDSEEVIAEEPTEETIEEEPTQEVLGITTDRYDYKKAIDEINGHLQEMRAEMEQNNTFWIMSLLLVVILMLTISIFKVEIRIQKFMEKLLAKNKRAKKKHS